MHSSRSELIFNPKPNILWTTWFFICLLPFSIEGGYSANYLFVLTPLICQLFGRKLYYPSQILLCFMMLSAIIFILAFLYQFDYFMFFPRRFISFLLFMSIFSLSVVDFSKQMTVSFLLALCLVAFYLSVQQVLTFFYIGEIDPNMLRGVTGTQRFGFLFIFSMWVLIWILIKEPISILNRFILVLVIGLIFFGLILSLSRSGYFGFIGSVITAFIPNNSLFRKKKIKIKIYNILFFVLFCIAILFFLMPILKPYFNDRISFLFSLSYLSDLAENADHETSEGYRILMWQTIVDYVAHNPFTGSGFLGIWAISGWNTSAHSEFFDRLLKLGVIGFFMYIVIIIKVFVFLRREYTYLSYGFFSALIIGLTHETFSLSHGACIYSFILMLYSKSARVNSNMKI